MDFGFGSSLKPCFTSVSPECAGLRFDSRISRAGNAFQYTCNATYMHPYSTQWFRKSILRYSKIDSPQIHSTLLFTVRSSPTLLFERRLARPCPSRISHKQFRLNTITTLGHVVHCVEVSFQLPLFVLSNLISSDVL